ncbi:replication factor-a protein [Anopheles sinensis]|uniref:Replication factor-a protein n=1 Tax=Anopheles sinensis TaxID=74873 RepID=A0A084VHQ8_ANOSI|nr:replication factor-a protein [Anopheles sinensis]
MAREVRGTGGTMHKTQHNRVRLIERARRNVPLKKYANASNSSPSAASATADSM